MDATPAPARESDVSETSLEVRHGVAGGIVAGIVFAMFEMVMAAILNGTDAFFMPLRMIGAIVLGEDALMSSYSLAGAAITGVVVHMVMSMVFGMIFALIAGRVPAMARLGGALIAAASVYGLLLWIVNFYLIAPVAGWDWFPDRTEEWVQFVAHTFMFGSVLGFYLDRVRDAARTP